VEAMLDMSRAEFQQTLRWARLDALRAEPVVLIREN